MTDASSEEQVMLVVHKHWCSLVLESLIIAFPGLLIGLLLLAMRAQIAGTDIATHALFTLLIPLTFLIIWIILAVVWTMYYLDALVVTDRRVFYTQQQSLVSRSVSEWNIDGLGTSVHISGALRLFFGYGTLTLEAPGQEPAEIPDIPNPERVSAIILRQHDRFGELEDTTRKQEELLKFLSHEVKGHLTKSKAMFSAIVEGDFGPVATPLGTMAQTALADTQKGVDTVMSILDDSNAKSGELAMRSQSFDLSASVRRMIQEFRPVAATKKLSLVSSVEDGCIVNGDQEKIERHVVRNFLDNAMRYTPVGQVDVVLEKINSMVRLSVTDTGIGISSTDMQKLFTEGGRGEHSRDINPESTGYGLFVAKQIVERHGGRIWARSAGTGTGSTFFAEFPLAQA